MTENSQSIQLLLGPVLKWLRTGGDAWEVNLEYWATRRELMEDGETFGGPPAEFLSNIDTAMDSFSPEPDRNMHQIDESQLRAELEMAIDGLRGIGYIKED